MATSSSNAVATFSSVFSITMDPNAAATLTSGMAPVAAAAAEATKRIEKSRADTVLESERKIFEARVSNHRAAMSKMREVESEEAAWRARLAEKSAAMAATRGHGAGLTPGPLIPPEEAEFRARLAAKHAAQMASAGLGVGRGAGGARGLEDQLQAENAMLAAAAEWRERLAAKHAAQMASAGMGAGRGVGAMVDLGAEGRAVAAAKTANIIAQVRQQQANRDAADEMMRSMQQEAAHLRWSVMTEKERYAVRKQADLEHLAMLRQYRAITDADYAKLVTQAGRLGLGNIPGDNNLRNRGFQGAMIAQQLGFGLQDFMSQVTNSKTLVDGLGRGLMATSNNVAMLGAAFNPTVLAVTAIGSAVIATVVPGMIRWLDTAQRIAEEEEKKLERQRELIELQDESRRRATEAMGRGTGGDMPQLTAQETLDVLKEQERNAWNEVRLARDRERILAAEESRLERQQARERQMSAWGPLSGMFGTSADARLAEVRRLIQEERESIRELDAEARASGLAGLSPDDQRRLGRRFREEEEKKKADAIKEHEADVQRWAQRDDDARSRQLKDTREAIEMENEARQMAIEKNRIAIEEISSKGGTSPLGMSAMSVAGTAAAASAINRALAGSRSEESDRKRQIQELEKINKKLEIENRKGSLEKAMLPQA